MVNYSYGDYRLFSRYSVHVCTYFLIMGCPGRQTDVEAVQSPFEAAADFSQVAASIDQVQTLQ